MLKNCFNLLLLILINNHGFSQSTISDSIIYTKSEDGTRILPNSFGVLNKKSGKIIIPKVFEQIQVCYKYVTNQDVFETNFFWVKKDNLWALYKKDRRLTEFKFLAPAYLSENLFPIKVGNKAGLIDTLGKEKLSFKRTIHKINFLTIKETLNYNERLFRKIKSQFVINIIF